MTHNYQLTIDKDRVAKEPQIIALPGQKLQSVFFKEPSKAARVQFSVKSIKINSLKKYAPNGAMH
jgi:hypothetical protein